MTDALWCVVMKSDDLLRRTFLARTGQYFALTLASPVLSIAQPAFRTDPFTLGVASGDPTANGVVLWTRLAPDPLNGGGMGNENVELEWVIATDEKLSTVVKKGKALATAQLAHSVHVEVQGLEPARWYWFQ